MVGKINYVFTALSNFLHVFPMIVPIVGWVFSHWTKESHKYNNAGCANTTGKFGRTHMF